MPTATSKQKAFISSREVKITEKNFLDSRENWTAVDILWETNLPENICEKRRISFKRYPKDRS